MQVLEPRRLFSSLVVTTVDDSTSHAGFVSLRDAIATANTDAAGGTSDTITFASSLNGDTIILEQGPLHLNGMAGSGQGAITINGANRITVSGNGGSVFQVSGITASISDLTITDGDAGNSFYSGGILSYSDSTLTVAGCTFSNDSGGDSGAGGIYNEGALTVTNSAFVNDSAGTEGGGIYNAGGTLTVVNSTLSDDTAGGNDGGGIYNLGTLTVVNSTLSDDTATDGGGIYNEGTLTLLNTIVAGNTASSESDGPDISGAVQSTSTDNLIGDGTDMSGISDGSGGNHMGYDPHLGPLTYYGGATQTMALLPGSPAIDAGGAITSLTSIIGSTDTTIPVTLAAAIASTPGSYVVQIDSEQMLVSNVDTIGNNLTVTRGYNGTTPTAHNNGSSVILPFDQNGRAGRGGRHRGI